MTHFVSKNNKSGRYVVMIRYPSGYVLATHYIFVTESEAQQFIDDLLKEKDMANFEGDVKNGKTLKANGMFENFLYDLTFQEDKCVWKNREELESYFLIMAVVFSWTVVIPIIKMKLYFDSRGKSDHRKR